MISPQEVQKLNTSHSNSEPKEIIKTAIELLPNFAISFSGAEDVALIDIASKLHSSPPIFTLDTGRLHPETYEFLETVRTHYSLPIETLHPDPEQLKKTHTEQRPFQLLQGRARRMLRDTQGSSITHQAGHYRRLDYRPETRPEPHPGRSSCL